MNIDLNLLFEKPNLDKTAILTIEPLAPLSIVSTLPGSYYKSQDLPTKANLCGMFENALGWHFGPTVRKAILKKVKQVLKKAYNINYLNEETSAVGFEPLLGHLFSIELPLIPPIVVRFDDYWTQMMKDSDARHLKGTPNLNYKLIKIKGQLQSDDKGKISDKTYGDFLKEHQSEFPMYYTSPTVREFIVLDGDYQIKILISSHLFEVLQQQIQENNNVYVGTNEGWVNLSLKEI